MASLGDLFLKLGVDVDDRKLQSFSSKVGEMPKKLINLKNAAIVAALFGIKKFVDSTIQSTVALENFNRQTGIAIESLQKWQVAAQLADTSLDEKQILGSVQALQQNLTQIRLGGGNVAPFQLLGIDTAGKDAIEVMDDMRDAIDGLDNATATNLIQQTGLSPNFINILKLSRKEFDKLSNVKFLSADQRDKIIDLGTAMTKLTINMKIMKNVIVAQLAPVLISIVQVLSGVGRAVSWLISGLSKMEGATAPLILIITALGVAFAPITTAIVFLLLLIEDLVVYLEGGDSWIGLFIEQMGMFGKAIYDLMIKPIEEFLIKAKEMVAFLAGGLGNKIKGAFGVDISGGVPATKTLPGGVGSEELIKTLFSGLSDSLKIFADQNAFVQLLSKAIAEVARIQPQVLAGPGGLAPVFNNTYNITTSGPGSDIAESMTDLQQNQFNQATANFNNGAER